MGRLQVGVLALLLASPSYALAAPPKALLGKPMPVAGAAARSAPAPASLPDGEVNAGPGRSLARAASVAAALETDQANLRGANDTRVYRQASPSVVLVVTEDSIGSGVLVSAKGEIVTNLHVVDDQDEVAVVFKPKVEGAEIADADVRPAKVTKRDEVSDLALLKVSDVPDDVTPLALGDDASVEVGADVHAIGHPTGQSWTYTRGIVSQVRKDYAWTSESDVEHKATVIQTQTPINPGNSGGPLINDKLEIIGINSFKSKGEGLNFAVSANDVKAFLARESDRAAPVAEECESVVLSEEPLKDPVGVEYLMDDDCDGGGDYFATVPDDKKEPIILYFDEDGDGKIDLAIFDDGHDGSFDLALFDTDGNEKWDMQGEFKPGEFEPYRYERIEEE